MATYKATSGGEQELLKTFCLVTEQAHLNGDGLAVSSTSAYKTENQRFLVLKQRPLLVEMSSLMVK